MFPLPLLHISGALTSSYKYWLERLSKEIQISFAMHNMSQLVNYRCRRSLVFFVVLCVCLQYKLCANLMHHT